MVPVIAVVVIILLHCVLSCLVCCFRYLSAAVVAVHSSMPSFFFCSCARLFILVIAVNSSCHYFLRLLISFSMFLLLWLFFCLFPYMQLLPLFSSLVVRVCACPLLASCLICAFVPLSLCSCIHPFLLALPLSCFCLLFASLLSFLSVCFNGPCHCHACHHFDSSLLFCFVSHVIVFLLQLLLRLA